MFRIAILKKVAESMQIEYEKVVDDNTVILYTDNLKKFLVNYNMNLNYINGTIFFGMRAIGEVLEPDYMNDETKISYGLGTLPKEKWEMIDTFYKMIFNKDETKRESLVNNHCNALKRYLDSIKPVQVNIEKPVVISEYNGQIIEK
ncbi:hypothetical protein [Wukongibacter sp. M2B1]|uniref:hypothetical protein n=1 Tax=Wukongibacter sp. M2B1 TaxID=3088895 RepID=UPI003D78E38B